jgi:predicted  nucleic acid-binding Zn-ribbon protein
MEGAVREVEAVPWFENHYECDACGCTWTDEWSAMCDDDCPECGARHMSPHASEQIGYASPEHITEHWD